MALSPAEKQRRYRQRKTRAGASGTPKPPRGTSKKKPPAPKPGGPVGTTLAECEKNVARLRRQAEAAAIDPDCSHQARASLGRALQSALAQLSTLRGEDELTEVRVIRSPAFSRVLESIDRVAASHPGPWVRALREALAGLP